MKRILFSLCATLTLPWAAHGQTAKTCDTSRAISSNAGNADFSSAVLRSLNFAGSGPSDCGTFIAVLRQLVSNKPRAGSQLKGASGPDAAKAADEIATLRSNAALAAELDSFQKEPSVFTRTMLEASHFHANGMYAARDLRLEQARQLVEGK